MPTLGTKKFWKPAPGASVSQKDNQILKNTGYINIQIVAVNYLSKGNFWQNTFGGSDKIALATNLTYKTTADSPVQAMSVQDVREIQVNHSYPLGLQRNIAVKIPANGNSLEMEVKITAVKNDALQAKFDMLNQPEYQSALQLAPMVVGQVLTITSLAKKLFSDAGEHAQLQATYAGIISAQLEQFPIENGKLTKGLLIMISTDEGSSFSGAKDSEFEMQGDVLYHNGEEVKNTHMVFNISFDALKGDDETSAWFKKYTEALNNLDKIQLTENEEEKKKIYADSKTMWIEGNALLDADVTYVNTEKMKLKATALKLLADKFKESTPPVINFNATESWQQIAGTADEENSIKNALPHTSQLWEKVEIGNSFELTSVTGNFQLEDSFIETLTKDAEEYISELDIINLHLKLGQQGPLLEGYGLKTTNGVDACESFLENEEGFLEAACAQFPSPWTGKKWRVAGSLKVLLNQLITLAPGRNRASDGTIGDVAHAARDSDHNPWVLDQGGNSGIVTAIDITHDPAKGCDCHIIAKSLQAAKDKRIKYVIWNKQIMSSSVSPWSWRPYGGSNPHTKHLHISVDCSRSLCDSLAPWTIRTK